MQERKQIGILLVATNRYKQFVQPLIDCIEKYFLVDHDVNIFLFTDLIDNYKTSRINIIQSKIPSYKFPYATLYRYKIFDDHKQLLKSNDYLFYLDVDMAIVGNVGDEIFNDGLTAVSHPGYFKSGGWGSSNCPKESLAYIPEVQRYNYCAGGFQGGKADLYLSVCNLLNARIQDDEDRGVMAEWHDETHWNWILNASELSRNYIKLNPSYCMVEQEHLRKLWGINDIEPKIIALAKNHKELRS